MIKTRAHHMLAMLEKELELFPDLANQALYLMAKHYPGVFRYNDGRNEILCYPDGSELSLDLCSGKVSARGIKA